MPNEYVPIDPAAIPGAGALTPRVEDPVTPPKPMNSLLAAATRITGAAIERTRGGIVRTEAWQEDAWETYGLVGEMRFLLNTLAKQMAKARWFVGELPDDPDDDPTPVTDAFLVAALNALGGGPVGLAQMIRRLCLNLGVVGDGWLVGIPHYLMPGFEGDRPPADAPANLLDMEWRMLSTSEVAVDGNEIKLTLGDGKDTVKASADDLWMVRVWEPHPQKFWMTDPATRSSLPVLRELVGLTMDISAQIDSRLAGAGVILVAESAARAARRALGIPEDDIEQDPLTDSLIKAMITPISDRSSAAAVVPLVWVLPDDVVKENGVQYMTFARPLDAQAKELRDEAIRRYALGADAPPELLLGMDTLNHWGAWLSQSDTIHTHVSPPLALIADAITVQYLRPVMEEAGYTPEQIAKTVVWFSVEHLIEDPSRADDADRLFQRGVISDTALRQASNFGEEDASAASKLSDPVKAALDLVRSAPALATSPGLDVIIAQMTAIFAGGTIPPVPTPPAADPVPSTSPGEAASTPESTVGGPPSADALAARVWG